MRNTWKATLALVLLVLAPFITANEDSKEETGFKIKVDNVINEAVAREVVNIADGARKSMIEEAQETLEKSPDSRQPWMLGLLNEKDTFTDDALLLRWLCSKFVTPFELIYETSLEKEVIIHPQYGTFKDEREAFKKILKKGYPAAKNIYEWQFNVALHLYTIITYTTLGNETKQKEFFAVIQEFVDSNFRLKSEFNARIYKQEKWLKEMHKQLSQSLGAGINFFSGLGSKFGSAVRGKFQGGMDSVSGLAKSLKNSAQRASDSVGEFGSSVRGKFQGGVDSMKDGFSSGASALKSGFSSGASTLKSGLSRGISRFSRSKRRYEDDDYNEDDSDESDESYSKSSRERNSDSNESDEDSVDQKSSSKKKRKHVNHDEEEIIENNKTKKIKKTEENEERDEK